jgi:hypothetical protein
MLFTKTTRKPSKFVKLSYKLFLLFITATSCLDAAMVVIYRTTAREEQNPLGSFLIGTTGQEGLFVVKMLTTMIVILFALFLFKKRPQAAYLIITLVTFFQLLLMCYIFS